MNPRSDQPADDIFEQISELSRQFRKQIAKGDAPRIERFLSELVESRREDLFSNLLEIEVHFRQRKGDNPSSAEYLKRFPQYAAQVRRAFFEPSLMSSDSHVDSPENVPTFVTEIPAGEHLGDYELIRELGRGGMGVVYEARHTQRNDRVALKTLPTSLDGQQHALKDADRLYKFRREFRALAEINHPHLVGMQTLEVEASQWFFTMDLIDGCDFLEYVRSKGQFNEQRLRAVLPQLVQGISTLHAQHIVHRDLKPSNVMINQSGQVVILDFGLVAELQERLDDTLSLRSGQFAGTLRYAAPEQLSGKRPAAIDWYALGVMMYEALTGTPPFSGTQADMIVQKQTLDAPKLTGHDDVPQDLAILVDQLLSRDPTERPDETSIASKLSTDLESSIPDSLDSEAEDAFQAEEVTLIGRETQLAELSAALQELQTTREPVVTFISGKSGEGKTSLAEAFLNPLRQSDDVLVLSGRCYDRESVPFKAVDTLIDALVAFLRPRRDQDVLQWLPDDIHMLAHLFPVLRRVEAIAEKSTTNISKIDDRQIRYRAFFALRELLTNMSRTTPVVLFIDDLQWGDADSAGALFDIISPPDPPAVLLLGSYRSDEADESPFLQEWKKLSVERGTPFPKREVHVEPLSEGQCLELLASQVDIDVDQLRDQAADLFQDTRGNPYFIEQLIEGFDAKTGRFKPVPLHEIIGRKLKRLPEAASSLLDVIAIAGQAVNLNEASQVAGHDAPMFSTITHMRSERLVRLVGSGDHQLVDTYHDKIRETMLDRMTPDARRAMHLRFAESIETTEELKASVVESYLDQSFTTQSVPEFSTARVYDLAYHFHLADDRRAFCYQFLAGELSFQTYASDEAIEYLIRASSLFRGDVPPRWRARLWHRLATSSCRVMDFDKSTEQFETGIPFAESGLEKALFYSGIATVHQTRARYDSATHFHDLALAEINRKRPQGVLAYPNSIINFTKLALFPEAWLCRTSGEPTEEERLELAIYVNLVQYLFDRFIPIIEYPAIVMRMGVLAHRADAAGFAAGVGTLAGHLGISGLPRLGKRHARRALAHIDTTVDAEAEGTCRYGAAIALSYSADFAEADREFDRAIALIVKSGSHFHGACALHLMRHLYESIGSAGLEVEVACRLVALTSSSGDLRALCWGHYDHAGGLARFGKTDKSLQAIEQAQKVWEKCKPNLLTPIYFANRGFVFLQTSEYSMAQDFADLSWRTAIKHLRVMDVCLRGLAWYLESFAGPRWSTDPTPFDRRLVRKRCRWARLLAWFHIKIRPHLLRSRGRALTALGKDRKGIRNFEWAVKSARQLGMKYDLAKSLLDLAAVKEAGREENRTEAIRLLKEVESVIPRAESWLLGDQYDEAVVAPEFDLEAWEREHGSVTAAAEVTS